MRTSRACAGLLLAASMWAGCDAALTQTPPTHDVFYVAGHAYGAHGGANPALHDPLRETLERLAPPPGTPIFFAGDFLRRCDEATWAALERELEATRMQAYLVRGSHERRAFCTAKIAEREGGLAYTVDLGNAAVIALDSENPDRTISAAQLALVSAALEASPKPERIFLVTHYLVWLSDSARYPTVRANQGSRFPAIANANYWNEIHPFLRQHPDVQFFLIAGDVGGRPDAIAAFYDEVDNVTLIATGMGEVEEENLLRVTLAPALAFEVIPLDPARPILPAREVR